MHRHVQPGDTVKAFDLICDVASDKAWRLCFPLQWLLIPPQANVEIKSMHRGKITKLHFGTGDIVEVGSIIYDIDAEGVSVHV